jgi:hypothetical protein
LYKGSAQIGEINKVVVMSEPKTSTIFFVTNGGVAIKPLTGYVGSAHGAFTTITRTGYTFARWNTTAALAAAYIETEFIEADLFVYASWTANEYAITFDSEGGTAKSNVTATFDAAMPSAGAVPTKGSDVFGGYFDGENGTGTKYYNADMTSARIFDKADATTLYAKWTAD